MLLSANAKGMILFKGEDPMAGLLYSNGTEVLDIIWAETRSGVEFYKARGKTPFEELVYRAIRKERPTKLRATGFSKAGERAFLKLAKKYKAKMSREQIVFDGRQLERFETTDLVTTFLEAA